MSKPHVLPSGMHVAKDAAGANCWFESFSKGGVRLSLYLSNYTQTPPFRQLSNILSASFASFAVCIPLGKTCGPRDLTFSKNTLNIVSQSFASFAKPCSNITKTLAFFQPVNGDACQRNVATAHPCGTLFSISSVKSFKLSFEWFYTRYKL
jgi:hypothetical protein